MSDNESFNVEAFIQDIFVRKQIWNGSSGNKDVFWGQLSEKYELPIINLKRKWENLRRSFRRQLKKIPRDSENVFLESPDSLNATFPYYRQMLFLADKIRTVPTNAIIAVKTENNSVQSSSNSASNGTNSIQTETITSPKADVQMKRQFDDSDDGNETVTPKKRRNSDAIEHQQMQNKETGNIPKMYSILSNTTTMEIDAYPNMIENTDQDDKDTNDNTEMRPNDSDISVSDKLYLKSLLHYLEKIDPSRKLYVRARIEEFLREELYIT